MEPGIAEALAAFRRFNYDHIYMRPASVAQAEAVVALLRALVEHYADRPHLVPTQTANNALIARCGLDVDPVHVDAGSDEALVIAVAYVGGMTDRFACQHGLTELDWDPARLPRGIGT